MLWSKRSKKVKSGATVINVLRPHHLSLFVIFLMVRPHQLSLMVLAAVVMRRS